VLMTTNFSVTALPATGKPFSRQASNPPCNGRIFLIPCFLSSSATRALVASFGQVQ
jgi:hypothetical protein